MTRRLLVLVIGLALTSGGCAALPLVALAPGAFSAGAGAAVNAGKEYANGGVVYRTFTLPLDELRLVVGDAFARMELAVIRDEMDDGERVIEAHARDREIKLRLEPVSRTVTRMRLVVSEKPFKKDRATATEIIVQTERTVAERDAARRAAVQEKVRDSAATDGDVRVKQTVHASDAASPARAVRARETVRPSALSPCRGWDGTPRQSVSRRAE